MFLGENLFVDFVVGYFFAGVVRGDVFGCLQHPGGEARLREPSG
jgi:hypothetical protein